METFDNFAKNERKILTYGGYFERFMETLSVKEREKVKYGLLLLKSLERLPTKFVKYIRDGLYELRTELTDFKRKRRRLRKRK